MFGFRRPTAPDRLQCWKIFTPGDVVFLISEGLVNEPADRCCCGRTNSMLKEPGAVQRKTHSSSLTSRQHFKKFRPNQTQKLNSIQDSSELTCFFFVLSYLQLSAQTKVIYKSVVKQKNVKCHFNAHIHAALTEPSPGCLLQAVFQGLSDRLCSWFLTCFLIRSSGTKKEHK